MTYDGRTKYDAQVAASYDADRQHEEHWQAEHEFLGRFAASNRLGRVLDVPVGTGRLLPQLASADSIIGLDVSEHMLAKARQTQQLLGLDQLDLVCGDALSTSFDDDEFDVIVCFRLVHLLPPELVRSLLTELSRICRGLVLLEIYASAPPEQVSAVRRLLRAVRRRMQKDSSARNPWSHIQSYAHTSDFVVGCAADVGLRIARSHHLGRYEGTAVEVLELAA